VNLPAIAAVASNTFKESARNRILYAIVGATLAACGLGYVLAAISAGDDPTSMPRRLRIIANTSLSAISLLGTLCAIFLGTNLVYQEVERKTVYTILARPIGRGEFIVGKFAGLAAVVVAAVLVMAIGFAAFYALVGGVDALSVKHAVAIFYTAVELVVVVAIALVFSSTANPIEGAIFAFVLTLAGHATKNLDALGKEITTPRAGVEPGALAHVTAKVLHAIYVVLPNLENFNLREQVTAEKPLELPMPHAEILAYAGLYTALLLAIAAFFFKRKTL
jgi:ABC-type transport system involved in multi-copper enzyme maturation permease subunit